MEASEAEASEEDQVPLMEPVFVPGRPLTTVQRTERLSKLIRAGGKRTKVSHIQKLNDNATKKSEF